jgi:hypothetical protein
LFKLLALKILDNLRKQPSLGLMSYFIIMFVMSTTYSTTHTEGNDARGLQGVCKRSLAHETSACSYTSVWAYFGYGGQPATQLAAQLGPDNHWIETAPSGTVSQS